MGEKIGIEYLFSQTGDVLENPLQEDTDGPDPSTSDSEDQIDEGFVEIEEEVEDLTISEPADAILASVPVATQSIQEHQGRAAHDQMLANRPSQTYLQATSSEQAPVSQPSSVALVVVPNTSIVSTPTPIPSTTTFPSTSDSDQESVGPGNIGGYQKVQALAAFLLSLLGNSTRVISNDQATKLIGLWNDLHPHDKMATRFAQRFQPTLVSGRFKQPKQKRIEMTPGVASVRRCFLGSNKGPAQWPSCNRYVEAIITRLCEAHPSPVKEQGQRKCRWGIVLKHYEIIRDLVYNCQRVVDETTIQLPSINQKTLTFWFNTKDKARDRAILEQGLTLQVPKVAAEALPLPLQKPTVLDSGTVHSEHQFLIQANTAGQTQKVRRRILPEQKPTEPIQIQPKPILQKPQTAVLPTQIIIPGETLKRKLPYSTERYKRKKLEKEAAGAYTRAYNRTAEFRRCRHCGKDVKSAGHVDYFKNIYCPETSSQTVEEWKAPLKLKYAKKK